MARSRGTEFAFNPSRNVAATNFRCVADDLRDYNVKRPFPDYVGRLVLSTGMQDAGTGLVRWNRVRFQPRCGNTKLGIALAGRECASSAPQTYVISLAPGRRRR